MNVKEKFLSLTTHTYPHGKEHELFDRLPQNLEMDDYGNLFIKIGESDVMFTSHLDTATSAYTKVNHVFDGDIIKTDGTSILGADDKAGMTIMLYMIEKGIPGLYYFFLGEEVGCVGSKKVAEKHKVEKLPYINKVISFDRRGTDSVITFQASSRCCSDKFGEELSKQLNNSESTFKYKNDPTGIYTDSAQFVKVYPECTNISVGYYSEHTYSERQDIEHLTKLAEACTKVDWNSLPVEKDPSKTEYASYGSSYGSRWSEWDDYAYETSPGVGYSAKTYTPPKATEKINFYDEEYRYVSDIEINKSTGEVVSINLSSYRLTTEEDAIFRFLDDIELSYETMKWDGLKLVVTYSDGRETVASRQELEEYIDELDLSEILTDEDETLRKNQYPIHKNWNYNYE
jgi:hypothetical protein